MPSGSPEAETWKSIPLDDAAVTLALAEPVAAWAGGTITAPETINSNETKAARSSRRRLSPAGARAEVFIFLHG
jgi:hypothetical protein